jgi:hypothetical protein
MLRSVKENGHNTCEIREITVKLKGKSTNALEE